MKRIIIIFVYFIISLTWLSGQEVKVSAAFDTTRIYIGDQIRFTVTIDKPVNYILSVPIFRDTLMKNIEILNGPTIDTTLLNKGLMRIRERYLITSFDSGFYQIPPVYAEMKNESGIKRYYSDYSFLEVKRVKITPPDSKAKIFDIIKPYSAPLTIGEILPWVLLLLLGSAGVWFLVRYLKKIRMNKKGEILPINPDPAHVIAFRELERLREEKLWQKGEIKKYYTRLTEIIRQYLENRFRIFSMEMTTVETLTELTKTGFREDENYRRLRTVLTGADLVKFAKYYPEPSENEQHFDDAWEFVEYTRIEDQPSLEAITAEQKNEEGV